MSLPHRIPASARVIYQGRDHYTPRHMPTPVARERFQPMARKPHAWARSLADVLVPAVCVAAALLLATMLFRVAWPAVRAFFPGVL